jgi:hypothetical protein
MVVLADHVPDPLIVEPSRSPTWIAGGATTVIVTPAGALKVVPSLTANVRESVPLNPVTGV